MARKPKDVIERAAIRSKDAMRRATTVRAERVVPIEAMRRTRPAAVAPLHSQPTPSMTRRVFISYARRDRPLAKALARYLEARGIEVWWDFRLYPGEQFRDRILAELKAAAAVVVIWSEDAVKSDFVLDEACRAKVMGKLVTTLAPGFSVADIPLGFGQSHAVSVGDRAQVVDALAEFGLAGHPDRALRLAQSPLA